MNRNCHNWRTPLFLAVVILLTAWPVQAEYADVVLNEHSEAEGMRPVIFSHWFHRIRFKCKVCHGELGFKMRVGSNHVSMENITAGEFCGACHNGEIAWAADQCDLCHSGKPGLKTGIQGGHETLGPGIW